MNRDQSMPVVYIAGPYRANSPWLVEQNIRAAETAMRAVVDIGMVPLCPHTMTRYMDGSDDYWLAATLELMRRCDAVLLTYPAAAEDSIGTRAEVDEALRIGIPVCSALDELMSMRESLARAGGYLFRYVQEETVLRDCGQRELVRENEVLRSENASLARQVESMAMRIESLAEELAKPEDVRLREVLDALDGRAVIFDGLGARVGHLLDEMDEWIGRAGEAERLAEERLAHANQLQADRALRAAGAPSGGAARNAHHR